MDAFEFHSHLEGVSDHSHGDASSKIIETQGHGIGRLRRALEARGYETRKLITATGAGVPEACRSEEHTSELQSLMRISYAVFCLKKKKPDKQQQNTTPQQC